MSFDLNPEITIDLFPLQNWNLTPASERWNFTLAFWKFKFYPYSPKGEILPLLSERLNSTLTFWKVKFNPYFPKGEIPPLLSDPSFIFTNPVFILPSQVFYQLQKS